MVAPHLPIVFPAAVAGKILCKKCLILLGQTSRSRALSAVPPKADMCSVCQQNRVFTRAKGQRAAHKGAIRKEAPALQLGLIGRGGMVP